MGAEAIIDAVVTNTSIFLRTSQASNGQLAGSLVLNNIKLSNVTTAVGVVGGAVVLTGGTTTIDTWAQGNVYTGTNPTGRFVQSSVTAPNKPSVLLDSAGRIFGKSHPQYENYAVDQFVSIRSLGAKGDGSTDDTQAIKNALAQVRRIFLVNRSPVKRRMVVCWLQNHFLRPRNIHCYLDNHHSRWHPNCRRSVVCHHGFRFRICGHEQPAACYTSWCCELRRSTRDH